MGSASVNGNHFQKVSLKPDDNRGGLLTQAGLLAMNSDGKDSNPLKARHLVAGKYFERSTAAPTTGRSRDRSGRSRDSEDDPQGNGWRIIETSRPACRATQRSTRGESLSRISMPSEAGARRTREKTSTRRASCTTSRNLTAWTVLKRYLLANRQDQFARAIVHKMTTFALGRPLTFGDRSERRTH